jgi:hypothetical protein
MPRNGSNVYSLPAGTLAVTQTVIESDAYNTFLADLVTDLNTARAVSVGGTGATTAGQALINLGALAVYTSRTAFTAASPPLTLTQWVVMSGNQALVYVADAAGTAITSANGLKGSPAGAVTPQHFGAEADGTTDDTAAIQAMIDYLVATTGDSIVGGEAWFPSGTYYVTDTLTLGTKLRFRGSGRYNTVIYRDGAYGDTFALSTGVITFDDMSFQHSTMPTALAAAAPIDDLLDDDSAHFRLTNTGTTHFNRCFFSRMPYGIIWTGASLLHLTECEFTGVWHPTDTTMQETKRSILLNDGTEDKSQLFKMTGCRWVGSVGPSTETNITDGSANPDTLYADKEGSWGPEYCMEIQCCEMLVSEGCYLNRGSKGLVLYAANLPENSGGPNYGHRWIATNFDSGMGQANTAYSNQITFTNREPGCVTRLIKFIGCEFYGGKFAKHAIYTDVASITDPDTGATTSNSPTVFGLHLIGCSFMNHTGAPIYLKGANGVLISGCIFSDWNSLGLPNVDKEYTAAVWRGQYANKVLITGNAFGGGGNTFVPVGSVYGSGANAGLAINHAYQGVYDDSPNDGELVFAMDNVDWGCREYLYSRLEVMGAYHPTIIGAPATAGTWRSGRTPHFAITLQLAADEKLTIQLPDELRSGFLSIRTDIMATNPHTTANAQAFVISSGSPSIVSTIYNGGDVALDAATGTLSTGSAVSSKINVRVRNAQLDIINKLTGTRYVTIEM